MGKQVLVQLMYLNEGDIDKLKKPELDAHIAIYLYGYRLLERSILGGFWIGVPDGETARSPVPESSTNANTLFRTLKKLLDERDVGDFFLEYWNDGEWFVCNRPLGHRDYAIQASCDGKKTGAPDMYLAVCRFIVKILRAELEIENDTRENDHGWPTN